MDMQKIEDMIKWVGIDGLLHLLVCWLVVLVVTPIRGIWLAILAAAVLSIGKEFWDMFIQKDNSKEQAIHDIICDGVGVLAGLLTIGLWWVVIF
jgi:hypothetical protein